MDEVNRPTFTDITQQVDLDTNAVMNELTDLFTVWVANSASA
jgi:hypothetical protein